MADSEEVERLELYMPAGLKLKKEYFSGFGKEELIPTIIALLVFLIIDSIVFMVGIHNITVLFFIPLLGTAAVGMMFIKGELNLSPVDIIKLEIQFAKNQKWYPYIAKDEWENIDEMYRRS